MVSTTALSEELNAKRAATPDTTPLDVVRTTADSGRGDHGDLDSAPQHLVVQSAKKEPLEMIADKMADVDARIEDAVNRDADDETAVIPDGGWGWLVCFSSFVVNAVLFGIVNTFGIIYVSMMEKYSDEENVAFKTAWVGSIQISLTFSFSPVASKMINRVGLRTTAVLGVVICVAGMLLSSMATDINTLYLTYGVFTGVGGSLVYTPSILILGHYFRRHLGLANGLVSTGSAISTIVLPLYLRYSLREWGLAYTLRVQSACYATLVLAAVTWLPILAFRNTATSGSVAEEVKAAMGVNGEDKQKSCCTKLKAKLKNSPLRKRRGFVIWVCAIPVGFLCYFTPFMHLVKHVNDILPDEKAELLIMMIGATSGVSRLVFGKLSDLQCVSRIVMQQLSFVMIGLTTALIPLATDFTTISLIVCVLGLADGCLVCLLPPIAFDLAGVKNAPNAIALLYFMMSIPITVGGPLSGWIYDTTKSYDTAFYIAGIPPIVAAAIMMFIPKVPKEDEDIADIKIIELINKGKDEKA